MSALQPRDINQVPEVTAPARSPAADLAVAQRTSFKARALLIGDRIDLRALELSDRLAAAPDTVPVRDEGVAVLFRYGAVVLFGVSPMEQTEFLTRLYPLVTQPYAHPEMESLDIRIDPNGREGMEGNVVVLREFSVDRLQMVASILAKSVVLAQYESKITQSFDKIEPFAVNLERSGRTGRQAQELLRHVGDALLSEQNMVARVEISDKPELLWERADLERLYLRLEDEFEIRERHTALERKMELISRTAQTVLELLQNSRSLRVEWYIVILIVLEIMLTLYDLFIRNHPS